MKTIALTSALLLVCSLLFAQGDQTLQSRGHVEVSWRLVSDFQPQGATCWGWTYHIFVRNDNPYPITLKKNKAYQNNGDLSSCWRSGEVSLGGETIPAQRWREFTFRVTSGTSGGPSAPGLEYSIDWEHPNPGTGNY